VGFGDITPMAASPLQTGSKPDDHIERFLSFIKKVEDEYESIQYRFFLHDTEKGLRILRAWISFQDLLPTSQLKRVDLGRG